MTVEQIRAKLPKPIKGQASAFLDDKDEAVPLYRQHKDYAIKLVKDDNGKEARVP
jgi:hypothetical protein